VLGALLCVQPASTASTCVQPASMATGLCETVPVPVPVWLHQCDCKFTVQAVGTSPVLSEALAQASRHTRMHGIHSLSSAPGAAGCGAHSMMLHLQSCSTLWSRVDIHHAPSRTNCW
jgi:hypothetical protein